MSTGLSLPVILLIALSALILLGVLGGRDRFVQFPFVAAAVILAWFVPQIIAVETTGQAPRDLVEPSVLFVMLCLLACWLGFHHNRRPARMLDLPFSRHRLVLLAGSFAAAGSFFYFRAVDLALDTGVEFFGAGSTGLVTAFIFLSLLLKVGLIFAVVVHVRQPGPDTLLIILFGVAFYLNRIVLQGRREAAVELAFIALYYIWFRYRWLPPRTLLLAGAALAFVFFNSMHEYRVAMGAFNRPANWAEAQLDVAQEIDFYGNFLSRFSDPNGNHEAMNMIMATGATNDLEDLDFGMTIWNEMVLRFVPAQIVGDSFKRSLYIHYVHPDIAAFKAFNYQRVQGSTYTGFTDAFRSFWYLGFVKFWLIAFIISRWYKGAVAGSTTAQIMIMFLAAPSVLAITHSTYHFFGALVLAFFVIILPLFLCLQIPNRRRPSASTDAPGESCTPLETGPRAPRGG
jgi:hypothetical protein